MTTVESAVSQKESSQKPAANFDDFAKTEEDKVTTYTFTGF